MDSQVVEQNDTWLWAALWSACATGTIKTKLNIIDTVLFTRGVPTRWLTTSPDGLLIARQFMDENAYDNTQLANSRKDVESGGKVIPNIVVAHRIAEIVQSFNEFLRNFNGGTVVSLGTPILSVLHKDGRREAMTGSDFALMSTNFQWLNGIYSLQPLLPPHEIRNGVYVRKTMRVGSKIIPASDFLGPRRLQSVHTIINERPNASKSYHEVKIKHYNVIRPVTLEDWISLRLTRLIHALFTVSISHGENPPGYFEEVQKPIPAMNKDKKNVLTSLEGSRLAARRAVMELSKTTEEIDAISSDSDTGHRQMLLAGPPRTGRVIASAYQFAIDSNDQPWLFLPLILCFQAMTPIASAYSLEARMNRALGAGIGPGGVPSNVLPKPADLGLPDEIARRTAWNEAQSAADTAHNELRKMVFEGAKRGLTIQTAFAHFDDVNNGNGSVSEDVFRKRLESLGIYLHEAAWKILCKRIPKEVMDGNISFDCFKEFIQMDPSIISKIEKPPSPPKQDRLKELERQNKELAETIKQASLIVPSISKDYSDLENQADIEGHETAAQRRRRRRREKDRSMSPTKSTTKGNTSSPENTKEVLDYTTSDDMNISTMKSVDTTTTTNNNNNNTSTSNMNNMSGDDAYDAAKNAYKALQNKFDSLKKKKDTNSNPNTPSQVQSISFPDSTNSNNNNGSDVENTRGRSRSRSPNKIQSSRRRTSNTYNNISKLAEDMHPNEWNSSTAIDIPPSESLDTSIRYKAVDTKLTDIVPDKDLYDIRPSGKSYDFGVREGPLLSSEAKPRIIKQLSEMIVTGKASSFGLVDTRLEKALINESTLLGGKTKEESIPAILLAGSDKIQTRNGLPVLITSLARNAPIGV